MSVFHFVRLQFKEVLGFDVLIKVEQLEKTMI